MKKYMNRILVLFLILTTINLVRADLRTELMIDSKLDQMDRAIYAQAKNEEKEKELELEVLLLLDSSKVIDDCVKNADFLKLKKVYDKMRADSLYSRPTKVQINEWRKIIEKHIAQAKVNKKNAKESNLYLKQAIKNGVALGISFALTLTAFIWGKNVISKASANENNYLAKYAIDAGLFIGFPLSSALLLKLIFELVGNDRIGSLQKMDSLLLLFGQLNDVPSKN